MQIFLKIDLELEDIQHVNHMCKKAPLMARYYNTFKREFDFDHFFSTINNKTEFSENRPCSSLGENISRWKHFLFFRDEFLASEVMSSA